MKRKTITLSILLILTVGMYFVFSQINPQKVPEINEISIIGNQKKMLKAVKKVITTTQKKAKGIQKKNSKSKRSDWKNWLFATLTSLVVYGIKKSIDWYFLKKKIKLEDVLEKE